MQSQNSWDLMLEVLHSEDRAFYTRSYELRKNEGSYDVEYRILRNDGEVRHIYEIGLVDTDNEGQIKSAFCLLQDITERKNYELKLENREADGAAG